MKKLSKRPLNRFVCIWLFIFLLLPVGYTFAQEQEVTEAELAQILAPVALYPDSLLTHVLIASTYPLEVIEAHRWRELQDDDDLDLSDISEKSQWEPSVVALLSFPTVLERMHDELTWTQQLGEAFLADEERVLANIQTLRKQADDAGSFEQMDNVSIVREEKVIIIEPEEPEIIYVPYYDTRIVYGNWRWHHYPPVHWHNSWHYSYHYGPFSWHAGVRLRTHFWFTAFHWHKRHVIINRPHVHHYRPRHKIVTSHHAKRWRHDPIHRRGATYRNQHVAKKYARHHSTHKKVHNNQHRKHVTSDNRYSQDRYTKVHSNIQRNKTTIKNDKTYKTHNRQHAKSYANNKTLQRHTKEHKKQYQESTLLKPKKYNVDRNKDYNANSRSIHRSDAKQYSKRSNQSSYDRNKANKYQQKRQTTQSVHKYSTKEPYQKHSWRNKEAKQSKQYSTKQSTRTTYARNTSQKQYQNKSTVRRVTSTNNRGHKTHRSSKTSNQRKQHR